METLPEGHCQEGLGRPSGHVRASEKIDYPNFVIGLIVTNHDSRSGFLSNRFSNSRMACGLTQEPVLATANTGKNRERFWKNTGEWTGRVEISKEEIPGSKHSMCGYTLTYSRP